MALFPCPECEQPVSTQATACPHCGFRLAAQPKPKKKKTSLTTMGCAAGFVSLMVCCGIGQISSLMREVEKQEEVKEQKEQAARIQAKRDAVVEDLKANPQPMVDKVDVAIEAGDLPKARNYLDTLDKAGFDTGEYRELIKKIEQQRAEERAAEARAKRHAEIEEGITAASDSKTRCETWQASWDKFKKLEKEDPPELYKRVNKAIKLIAKCRRGDLKKLERETIKERTAARVAYADALDTAFLQDDMDVRVKAYSTNKTKLKLTYVFFSNRVWVKKVTDTGMLTKAENLGFTKVHFDSGFGEGFVYNLEPISDKERVSLMIPDPKPFEVPKPADTSEE